MILNFRNEINTLSDWSRMKVPGKEIANYYPRNRALRQLQWRDCAGLFCGPSPYTCLSASGESSKEKRGRLADFGE
jgi:hypothetical protein